MPGVQDRVIVVTGAGGGLGREYALALAREGASVVVNDLGGARDGTGAGHNMADEVVKEIKDAGGRAAANYDSVATEDGAANIVKTALDEFGAVHGVVSNAGILRDGTFHKMTSENWDAVLKVHLYGGYNIIRAAWPHFRDQSYGRVVVATSTSGLFGNFGQTNYGAAKLGLVGLINTLAQEGAKYNIHSNAVAPIAATRVADLRNDLVGHRRSGACAIAGSAQVIDDDAGAFPGEGQGVFTAQSPAGSRDDDDAILHSGHQVPLLLRNLAYLRHGGTAVLCRRRAPAGPLCIRTACEPV